MTVQRMKAEFAPTHEIEAQVSRIQEEQRSILLGEETKHKVTIERMSKELAEYKDRLKIAEANFSPTASISEPLIEIDGTELDHLKQTKMQMATTFAKEIE